MPSLSNIPRIVITSGEPAGIGPDICILLAKHAIVANITIIGDANMLAERAKQLNIQFDAKNVLHTPTASPVIAGSLNAANSQYVLDTLNIAINGCINGKFDALVTAPVHKGIINDAGIAFSGHTEFLAEKTNTPQVVMMLVDGNKSGGLRVALATTHLALKDVPSAITQSNLEATIRILYADLLQKFGIIKCLIPMHLI